MKKLLFLSAFFYLFCDQAANNPSPANEISAPTHLTAELYYVENILLEWSDNSTNEDGFVVERRTGVGAFEEIATLIANNFTFLDTSFEKNKTYTYRIYAYNEQGNSNYSNFDTIDVSSELSAITQSVRVYGTISGSVNHVETIEGLVISKSLKDTLVYPLTVSVENSTAAYSGVIAVPTILQSFSIAVRVTDMAGTVMGYASQPQLAIPPEVSLNISTGLALPTVLCSTVSYASVNDTFTLFIDTAIGSYNTDVTQFVLKNDDGPWVVFSGNDTVLTAPDTIKSFVCSLKVVDENLKTSVTACSLQTVFDLTAPTVSATINSSTGLISVTTNEPATVYFYEVQNGSSAPATAAVRASAYRGAASPATPATHTISATIAVDVYVVAVDEAGNASLVTSAGTYTPTNVAPMVSVAVSGDPGSTTNFSVTSSVVSTVYLVVIRGNATSLPSAANIKAGLDETGTATALKGSGSVVSANGSTTIAVSGFTPGQTYLAFAVAESAAGAISAVSSPASFTIAQTGITANIVIADDDSAEMYINGIAVPFDGEVGLPTAMIQPGSNCAAVVLTNKINHYGGAFLMGIKWDTDTIVTDSTWKYSFTNPTGWDQAGYDDSQWFNAWELNETGKDSGCPQSNTIDAGATPARAHIDSIGHWLWSSQNCYYRKSITIDAATNCSLHVAGLQKYTLYLNGTQLTTDEGTKETFTATRLTDVALNTGENVFAIHVADSSNGAFGGNFIFQALTATGDSIVSDSTWKSHVIEPSGWNNIGFDDSNWFPVTAIGDYKLTNEINITPQLKGDYTNHWLKGAPFYRIVGGSLVVSSARWISTPYTIYFRKEF